MAVIELTDWYPADIRPVRRGVYQRLNTSTGMTYFSRWDDWNGCWCKGEGTIEAAAFHIAPSLVSNIHPWPWRGIKEPK